MSYKVERIDAALKHVLGEGPFWDVASQSLYFVDSYHGTIHCYSLDEDKVYSASIDKKEEKDTIGFIIPVKGKSNHFAIGLGMQVVEIEWDSRSPIYKFKEAKVMPEGKKESCNRLNDAKADSKNRLYFGSMARDFDLDRPSDLFRTGDLYYKAKGETIVHVRDKVGVSNGITWNKDETKMYYVDSVNKGIDEFDYDKLTGKLSNPKRLFDLTEKGFTVPDGMTNDIHGYLYLAVFDGNRVMKIDPRTKTVVLDIIIPDVTNVTSCAFGGPDMKTLFVTSACYLMNKSSPHFNNAGGLYKVTFNDGTIKGREMHRVEL